VTGSVQRTCSQCGQPQTAGAAAEGLCPHCLLTAGLGHDYAVLNVLGQGEHGTVYLAEQQPSGRLVALKVLAGNSAGDILSRLRRQAPMLGALDHPNAARTLDIAVPGDPEAYVATEYVRGSPITSYCERLQIPRAGRLQLLAAVGALLRCAHDIGVTHGGIKPSNVLVFGRAATPSVKVTDFGLSFADARADDLALAALAEVLVASC
jgi:eukaryotic-like serine/threonine-protein kinase